MHTKLFCSHLTHVHSWLQAEIVACDTLNKRAQMLKRFIRIAEHLMALNNFNSLFAMYCGLGANPIFRLKKTWAELNARTGAIVGEGGFCCRGCIFWPALWVFKE